jgi:3-isopropylmalate dehydratase small subunit
MRWKSLNQRRFQGIILKRHLKTMPLLRSFRRITIKLQGMKRHLLKADRMLERLLCKAINQRLMDQWNRALLVTKIKHFYFKSNIPHNNNNIKLNKKGLKSIISMKFSPTFWMNSHKYNLLAILKARCRPKLELKACILDSKCY